MLDSFSLEFLEVSFLMDESGFLGFFFGENFVVTSDLDKQCISSYCHQNFCSLWFSPLLTFSDMVSDQVNLWSFVHIIGETSILVGSKEYYYESFLFTVAFVYRQRKWAIGILGIYLPYHFDQRFPPVAGICWSIIWCRNTFPPGNALLLLLLLRKHDYGFRLSLDLSFCSRKVVSPINENDFV